MSSLRTSRRTWFGAAAVCLSSVLVKPASAAEKRIELQRFDRVSIDLSAQCHVVIGTRHAIRIQAEDKVLRKISATVNDGTLTLTAAGSFQTQQAIIVEISTAELREATVNGAASLTVDTIKGNRLDLHSDGSGQIAIQSLYVTKLVSQLGGSSSMVVAGRVSEQTVSVSDAARFEAERLPTEVARVQVQGAGNAALNVSRKLDVSIQDAGSVGYLGDPLLSQRIEGAGRLEKIE